MFNLNKPLTTVGFGALKASAPLYLRIQPVTENLLKNYSKDNVCSSKYNLKLEYSLKSKMFPT